MNRMIIVFIAVLYSGWIGAAENGSYESIDGMKTIAKDFLINSITVDPGDTLDVKISQTSPLANLRKCDIPVRAALPDGASKEQVASVELNCDGKHPWHVFLPVDVQVKTKVLVTKNIIQPHESIREDDLDYAMMDKNRLYNGFYKSKDELIGMESINLLPVGTVVTSRNTQHPVLVHRNEVIDLVAGSAVIVVTMKGISKSEGRLNEVIKAYNPSTSKSMDAIVVGPGKARVVS